MANVDINVHHITRVEGHGNIVVKASDGKVEQVEWQVPEAPRFFEAMVVGRPWHDIQTIVSRICGICSISHSLTAVNAVEDALKIPVSEQVEDMRLLTHYSEQLQSHVLHVGYLVAPDLLGARSVVELVRNGVAVDAVKVIVKLHRIANEWSDLLAGRTTHPTTFKPGGFTQWPSVKQLKDLQNTLKNDAVPGLKAVAEVVLGLADKIPNVERPTEYISLGDPDLYPFYHGQIASTDTDEKVDIHEFERVVNEFVSPQSTAKWTKWHRDSYAVGALARFNNNAEKLLPLAAETARAFGLEKGNQNPYMNNVAQLVECVQVVEHGIQLIDEILDKGYDPQQPLPGVEPRAGEGVGCNEAPRGILFHRYEFDDKGRCVKANICIPTNQNHNNIQKDFEALVPQWIDKPQEELTLLLEMLVRSYDPCISCSAHYLDVKFE